MKRYLKHLSMFLLIAGTVHQAYAQKVLPNMRPYDKRGLNMFEPPKNDTATFTHLQLKIGAGFTQQFQALRHSNEATPNIVNGVDQNKLITIGNGFNLATANLNLDAELADGIELNVITYLSSRHHNDTWVKGGYLQIDKLSFLHNQAIDHLMNYVRFRVGDFEINYGDAHFRRTDNGQAIQNPFVGNYIMDAFMTAISGEAYVMNKGWIGMIGVAGSQVNTTVTNPSSRGPAIYGKLGFDKQFTPDLRFRLTGSIYTNQKSPGNQLYNGDRGGSRYYLVMENTQATISNNAWSGEYNPQFSNHVTSIMINPFIQYRGLTFFGTYEHAQGRTGAETSNRKADQLVGDLLYYFGPRQNIYVGIRYDWVKGELPGVAQAVQVDRVQAALGWYIAPTVLLKAEYVDQRYHNYPTNNINYGGQFHGLMLEGTVGF
ncbi:MAG: hypothetical protein IMW88_11585 [Thermoflavifilum sp.]|uniref:hypothetical protein n=1 Tax=Thermoflavifilum sp. TaxID=1968839 RepID=UPI0018A35D31|nr:hypothetical protein [Thermoflavifilum sp.]QOR75930.1 MAG: hypothetical protein IMW88_11585 [Thermoflavifilum sp.]